MRHAGQVLVVLALVILTAGAQAAPPATTAASVLDLHEGHAVAALSQADDEAGEHDAAFGTALVAIVVASLLGWARATRADLCSAAFGAAGFSAVSARSIYAVKPVRSAKRDAATTRLFLRMLRRSRSIKASADSIAISVSRNRFLSSSIR